MVIVLLIRPAGPLAGHPDMRNDKATIELAPHAHAFGIC